MSQEFFKKYFLVNFSDAQGLKPLLFVMLCIDAQAAVLANRLGLNIDVVKNYYKLV